MTNTLIGKTIVIAGGSSGMGLALARQATSQGAVVHLLGRSVERLERARASIDGTVHVHRVDIGREDEVQALSTLIPHLDHLVVTAADLVFKPFTEITNDEVHQMLAGKFWGSIHLVRHFADRLSSHGSVTFYSGSAAYKAVSGGSVVAALNGALDGFMRTLAVELAPIRFNVISPGVVDSPVWDFLPSDSRSTTLNAIGAALPAGRVGTVDDLADAALFVMRNGYTTGTVLQIDGGANA